MAENSKERVFIAIGSNLGDRAANVRKAVGMVTEDPSKASLVAGSSLYETAPWGKTDQPPFINCVIEVATRMPPKRLLEFLKAMEAGMGRVSSGRWGPRVIDLDIIFYGDRILEEEGLKIPHPFAHGRGFVIVPLAEVAPDFIHPVFKKRVEELAAGLVEAGDVKRIEAP